MFITQKVQQRLTKAHTAITEPHALKALTAQPVAEDRDLYAAYLRERLYGTLTLMAVVASLLATGTQSVAHATVSILSTVGGLWLASFFATITAHRVVHDKPLRRNELWHEFIIHRGLLSAAVPSLALLGLAALGFIGLQTALMTDIVLAIAFTVTAVLRSAKTNENSRHTAVILSIVQLGLAGSIIAVKSWLR